MTKDELYEYIKLNIEKGLNYSQIAIKMKASDFNVETTLSTEYRRENKIGLKLDDKMLSAFMIANGYRLKPYYVRRPINRNNKPKPQTVIHKPKEFDFVSAVLKSGLDKDKKLKMLEILL